MSKTATPLKPFILPNDAFVDAYQFTETGVAGVNVDNYWQHAKNAGITEESIKRINDFNAQYALGLSRDSGMKAAAFITANESAPPQFSVSAAVGGGGSINSVWSNSGDSGYAHHLVYDHELIPASYDYSGVVNDVRAAIEAAQASEANG